MTLPERSHDAEDAFVAVLAASDDNDALTEAVSASMAAGRPRLAARLVGLLSDRVEVTPGSDLARAQRAAHLLLFDKQRPQDLSWSELEDAWGQVRRRRMRRIRDRMRAALSGSRASFGRLGNKRRR